MASRLPALLSQLVLITASGWSCPPHFAVAVADARPAVLEETIASVPRVE
jgi:hypothetical protein